MGERISEVGQEAMAQRLGDRPVEALDDLCTDLMISPDYLAELFGIELAGEAGGVYEITDHHSELAA
jgi:hypothetical protein